MLSKIINEQKFLFTVFIFMPTQLLFYSTTKRIILTKTQVLIIKTP
jgi:hypothetical protein